MSRPKRTIIVRLARLAMMGIALTATFSLLMVFTYVLPDGPIRSHMPTSIAQLQTEGHPYYPFVGLQSLMPDNFTDALMLNQALSPPSTNPLSAAFGNYMQVAPGEESEPVPLDGLKAAVAGVGSPIPYARYWHGYQVFLRPALLVMDYRAIRFLNAILLAAAVAAAAVALRLRLGLKALVAFLVSMAVVGIVVVPMSLQYSSVFYVMLGGVIAVALLMDRDGELRWDLEVFLVLGALTSFLDLLTAPVLSLGIPLAVVLIGRMGSERGSALRAQIAVFGRLTFAWFVGYAGCWAAKWALSSVVLGRSVLGEGLQNVAYRMQGAEAGVATGPAGALARNAAMLLPLFGWGQRIAFDRNAALAVFVLLCVPMVALLVLAIRYRRPDGRGWRLVALGPVLLLPFAWYVVVSNHSWVHYWMTYRALAIAVFVAIYGLLYLVDPVWTAALRRRLERRFRFER